MTRLDRLAISSAATGTFVLVLTFSGFAQVTHPGADYGARDPTVCKDSKAVGSGAPSPQQAAQYVACEHDGIRANHLYLYDQVKVEIGAARRFGQLTDLNLADADTKSAVYPIRGSYRLYICEHQVNNPRLPTYNNVGKNCSMFDNQNATGLCWKTSFGDWRCDMTSEKQDPNPKHNVAPPAAPGARNFRAFAERDWSSLLAQSSPAIFLRVFS